MLAYASVPDARLGFGQSSCDDDVVLGDGLPPGRTTRDLLDRGVRTGRAASCSRRSGARWRRFRIPSDAAGHQRIPHIGAVHARGRRRGRIALHCVDRGSLDDTVIGRGTKIDNLVHVGHNVRVGEHCLLAWRHRWLPAVSRIGNVVHRSAAAAASPTMPRSAMARDAGGTDAASSASTCRPGAVVGGYPARDHREFLRAQAALYGCPPSSDRLER